MVVSLRIDGMIVSMIANNVLQLSSVYGPSAGGSGRAAARGARVSIVAELIAQVRNAQKWREECPGVPVLRSMSEACVDTDLVDMFGESKLNPPTMQLSSFDIKQPSRRF